MKDSYYEIVMREWAGGKLATSHISLTALFVVLW